MHGRQSRKAELLVDEQLVLLGSLHVDHELLGRVQGILVGLHARGDQIHLRCRIR